MIAETETLPSWEKVTGDPDLAHIVPPTRFWRWRVFGGRLYALCGEDVTDADEAPEGTAVSCVPCVEAHERGAG